MEFFERINPTTKIVWVIAVSIISFICAGNLGLVILYIYVISLYALSKNVKRYSKQLFKFSIVVLLVFSITQGLFYKYGGREILICGLRFSIDGFAYGMLESLIILTMASASILVSCSTPPEDMINAFSRLGLPQSISFMASLALRFLPTIMEDTKIVINSLKSRGVDVDSLIGKFLSLKVFLPTLLITELRRGNNIAIAISLRGYEPEKKRYKQRLKFGREDLLLFVSLAVIILAIIALNHLLNIYLILPPWEG
jgi:energy-coupling factor transport system permease protein